MQSSPIVNAAVVILQYSEGRIHLTLVKSKNKRWSLPEVSVPGHETSLAALEKGLRRTIGLKDHEISYREQLYTTEQIIKSVNHLSIAYLYLSRGTSWHKGSQQIGLFSISKLPRLSKPDGETVHYALERLHSKALYSTVLSHLLPKDFYFRDLQLLFETATGQEVDRRNFRKKMLDLDVLKKLDVKNQSQSSNGWRFAFLNQTGLDLYDKPFLPPRSDK